MFGANIDKSNTVYTVFLDIVNNTMLEMNSTINELNSTIGAINFLLENDARQGIAGLGPTSVNDIIAKIRDTTDEFENEIENKGTEGTTLGASKETKIPIT